LDLTTNLISTLPSTLSNLTDLKSLNLSRNGLTGSVPTLLSSLSHLERLDLSYNNMSGPLPVFFASFASMRSLSVASNSLSGTLPAVLGLLLPVDGGAVLPFQQGGGMNFTLNYFSLPPPAALAVACAGTYMLYPHPSRRCGRWHCIPGVAFPPRLSSQRTRRTRKHSARLLPNGRTSKRRPCPFSM
jgi:hypothetical protein